MLRLKLPCRMAGWKMRLMTTRLRWITRKPGVGKPTTLNQAHVYYHLGLACEKLGRFRQALRRLAAQPASITAWQRVVPLCPDGAG